MRLRFPYVMLGRNCCCFPKGLAVPAETGVVHSIGRFHLEGKCVVVRWRRTLKDHCSHVVQAVGDEQGLELWVLEETAQYCTRFRETGASAPGKRVPPVVAHTIDGAGHQRLIEKDPQWRPRHSLVERVRVPRRPQTRRGVQGNRHQPTKAPPCA
jgi:hypothetical protein